MTPSEDKPPRASRGMFKRFAAAAVVLVLLSAAATATAGLLELKDNVDIFISNSKPIADIEGALDDVEPGAPQTILLLGSDRRFVDIATKAPTRSDTIILVRLDPSQGATAVMSLPRDLKVHIPGHGTDKINAAYANGGDRLTVRTVRELLGIPINHVVNVNFGGFQRAVNRLGCVYTDIDHRYFNDNNPPAGGGGNYATIDIDAGYQRLCGKDALDFVRYRHLDSDLVRAARQQEFLRQAKDQIGLGKLFSDRKALIKIFARYTQTDIGSNQAILRLLKLGIESAQNPLQEVQFPGEVTGEFVEASKADLQQATDEFMHAKASPGGRNTAAPATQQAAPAPAKKASGRAKKKAASLPPTLHTASQAVEDEAVRLATKLPFAVFWPKAEQNGAQLLLDDTRTYDLFDSNRHRYRAYRMVFRSGVGELGQYYGVQGTNWKAPPILDNPSEQRRMAGRTYDLFFDGERLRLVAWRTKDAVYWISNTLLQRLSDREMLALARSVSKIG